MKLSCVHVHKIENSIFLVKLELCDNENIYDASRELEPFAKFEKREEQPWRSVTFIY